MKEQSLKIEVFHSPETRSDRVLWAVNELGLEDVTTVKSLDIFKGEQYSEEYRALNPLMQIPVVVLTDVEGRKREVTESCIIPAILSEACDNKLAPPKNDILSRATYHRVNTLCAANIDQMIASVVWNEKYAPEGTKDMKAAARGRADFKTKGVVVVENILGENDYICGPYHDEFTMADISLAWILHLANEFDMLEGHLTVKAYVERCMKRPAWRKVHR